MSRRGLLLAAAAATPGHGAPTDDAALNEFAGVYNAYVEQLRAGRVDLKAWQRVDRAWRKLTPDVCRSDH